MTELSPEAQAAAAKAQKLLKLAAGRTTPEEAASATAKAMELLAAYNLTMAQAEQAGSDSGKREQARVRGGMYQYQQDLWRAIAELNFCLYWRQRHYLRRTLRRRAWDGQMESYELDGYEFRHTLVGRVLNVTMTRNMGQYLEEAIERLVKERFPLNSQRFERDAVSFREGIASELVCRLRDRRIRVLQEERERAAKAAAGNVTAQALTLGSLAQREREANADFLYGEGWSAKQAAERARQAAAARAAEEAYTKWAAENPEEAAKEEARAEAEARKRDSRRRTSGIRHRTARPTAAEQRSWSPYYRQGVEASAKISLDPQAESRQSDSKRRLTHG